MKHQEIIKKWTEENKPIGEMLGYPDCCVKEFCELPPRLMTGKPNNNQIKRVKAASINGKYTGFIPCSNHAKQILLGKITLESLVDKTKRANNKEYFIPPFPHAF